MVVPSPQRGEDTGFLSGFPIGGGPPRTPEAFVMGWRLLSAGELFSCQLVRVKIILIRTNWVCHAVFMA